MVGVARAPLRFGVLALLAGSLVAGAARAQERDPREAEAKRACLANQPDRGIELLAELYAETNDPTYIYNQGRCFEQNGKASDALTRFREYLRKVPGLSPDERAQVQAHITDMEQQARQAAPAPVVAAPAPALPPPAAAPAADTSRRLRVAALAAASVGVVLVASAAYFGARTQTLSDEVTADAKKGLFSQSKYDEGQRDQLLQWVGYGVGAAALVGGGLLYLLGVNRAAESSTVTAMPSVAPGGAGASLRVTF
jgi:hypothetical protein